MRLFFTEKPTSLSTEKEAKRDERIGRSSLEIQISINLCLFLISRADSLISGSSSIQWLSSQKQCPSRCCHLQLKASGDAAEGAEPGHWTCRRLHHWAGVPQHKTLHVVLVRIETSLRIWSVQSPHRKAGRSANPTGKAVKTKCGFQSIVSYVANTRQERGRGEKEGDRERT